MLDVQTLREIEEALREVAKNHNSAKFELLANKVSYEVKRLQDGRYVRVTLTLPVWVAEILEGFGRYEQYSKLEHYLYKIIIEELRGWVENLQVNLDNLTVKDLINDHEIVKVTGQ